MSSKRKKTGRNATGRNAGAAAKAVVSTSPGGGLVAMRAEARDITQALAERMAETRFTDMMAAAGVGHDRMALELLYWLPMDFLDLYQELYMRGLANTDGGTEARGRAGASSAAVGKAAAKTAAGQKTYKKYWVVGDEDALELKERVDKRLRAMTREMRLILAELDFMRDRRSTEKKAKIKTGVTRVTGVTGSGVGGKGEKVAGVVASDRKVGGTRCGECGILMATHWMYCSKCGCPTSNLK